jgi:hypothetical protein
MVQKQSQKQTVNIHLNTEKKKRKRNKKAKNQATQGTTNIQQFSYHTPTPIYSGYGQLLPNAMLPTIAQEPNPIHQKLGEKPQGNYDAPARTFYEQDNLSTMTDIRSSQPHHPLTLDNHDDRGLRLHFTLQDQGNDATHNREAGNVAKHIQLSATKEQREGYKKTFGEDEVARQNAKWQKVNPPRQYRHNDNAFNKHRVNPDVLNSGELLNKLNRKGFAPNQPVSKQDALTKYYDEKSTLDSKTTIYKKK